MLKKSLLILISAFVMHSVAFAANDQVKIGIIDMNKIMQEAPAAVKISKQLEGKFKPRQEKLMAMEKQLQEKIEKFKRDSSVMTDAKRDAMNKDIYQERRQFMRMQQDFRDDFELARNTVIQKFLEQVKPIIHSIAKEGHYTMVLEPYGVLYMDDKVDLTEMVMKKI